MFFDSLAYLNGLLSLYRDVKATLWNAVLREASKFNQTSSEFKKDTHHILLNEKNKKKKCYTNWTDNKSSDLLFNDLIVVLHIQLYKTTKKNATLYHSEDSDYF